MLTVGHSVRTGTLETVALSPLICSTKALTMSVQPIPDGYRSVTPYLLLENATQALEFYKKAFDAEELMRLDQPDGKIGHAEVQIGNSILMMADAVPEMGMKSPGMLGGTPVNLLIYCEDCDKLFSQAIEAGATEVRPMQDQFYGDRSGMVTDPFGHTWSIATHVEDVTNEELEDRLNAMMNQEEE